MVSSADLAKVVTDLLDPYYGKDLAKKYVRAIFRRTQTPHRVYQLAGKLIFNYETDEPLDPQKILWEPLGKEWDSCLYDKEKKDIKKLYAEVGKPIVKEGAIKCYRCGTNKCFYYQIQTRSADEGMTTFYTCTQCGKRWKR